MFNIQKPYLTSGWHLVFYQPGDGRNANTCSNYILRFKDGETRIVNIWADWIIEELTGLNKRFDFCIRALGSTELIAGNRPLDIVGYRIMEANIATYFPTFLSKTRVTPAMHTIKNKDDRIDALRGAYDCHYQEENRNHAYNFLLLDDVITSGTTTREIVKTIKMKYPNSNISLLCLAHTSRDSGVNDGISLIRFNR